MARYHMSVTLSPEVIDYVRARQETCKGKSFSEALEVVVRQHMNIAGDLDRKNALTKLRKAATVLHFDHDISQEAIISWVKGVTGKK